MLTVLLEEANNADCALIMVIVCILQLCHISCDEDS